MKTIIILFFLVYISIQVFTGAQLVENTTKTMRAHAAQSLNQ